MSDYCNRGANIKEKSLLSKEKQWPYCLNADIKCSARDGNGPKTFKRSLFKESANRPLLGNGLKINISGNENHEINCLRNLLQKQEDLVSSIVESKVKKTRDGSNQCKKESKLQNKQELLSFKTISDELNILCRPCNVEDYILCPQMCGCIIRKKDLLIHQSLMCKAREVTCPHIGCLEKYPLYFEKEHSQQCYHRIRRNKILKMKYLKQNNGTPSISTNMSDELSNGKAKMLKKKKNNEHLIRRFKSRMRMKTETKSMIAEDFLTSINGICPLPLTSNDRTRYQLSKRYHMRCNSTFVCSDCGENIPMMAKLKHPLECPNRLVPCKNSEFGCPVMVRLRDRWKHEKVENLVKPRCALQLFGTCGYLLLDGEDLKGCWTAEFWVLRSNTVEAAVSIAKKVIASLVKMKSMQQDLFESHNEMEKLKHNLNDLSTYLSKSRSSDLLERQSELANKLLALQKETNDFEKTLFEQKQPFSFLVEETYRLLKETLCYTEDTEYIDEDFCDCLGEEAIDNKDNDWFLKILEDLSSIHTVNNLYEFISVVRKEFCLSSKTMPKNKQRRNKMSLCSSKSSLPLFSTDHESNSMETPTSSIGGLDVLASSETFTLFLHGKDGKVGFSERKTQYENDNLKIDCVEHTIDYQLPRNKWYHIAYVGSNEGTTIHVNGEVVGKVNDCCMLPLKSIFSETNSLHGAIQEIRYWNCERNRKQLRMFMNRPLPMSAVEQGLIGYWTFEEGSGRYLNDITGKIRYQSTLFGHFLWTTEEKIGINAPIPAWREQYVCKKELHRLRLACAGKIKLEIMECPECGDLVIKRNMKYHRTYMCKITNKLSSE